MIVIVIYILFIIIYALFKKVNAFESFSKGIENNYKTVINIFPTIMVLIIAINVFINSGIIEIFRSLFPKSIFAPELFLQAFLRPLSHSSALVMMVKIFEEYGVDSNFGNLSSILQGCNDTTVYIIALYFGSIKMKNIGNSLKIGLLNDVLTFLFLFFLGLVFIMQKWPFFAP